MLTCTFIKQPAEISSQQMDGLQVATLVICTLILFGCLSCTCCLIATYVVGLRWFRGGGNVQTALGLLSRNPAENPNSNPV
jgi:hypothetical protein